VPDARYQRRAVAPPSPPRPAYCRRSATAVRRCARRAASSQPRHRVRVAHHRLYGRGKRCRPRYQWRARRWSGACTCCSVCRVRTSFAPPTPSECEIVSVPKPRNAVHFPTNSICSGLRAETIYWPVDLMLLLDAPTRELLQRHPATTAQRSPLKL